MLQLFQSFIGTGDQFLIYRFVGLIIALLVIIATCLCLFKKSRWKLHQIYFIAVFWLGLVFMCTLPPLSAPDEILHFTGAYALSNQLMGQSVRDEDGHVRIRQEDEYLVNWPGDNDPCKATVLGQTLDRSVYEAMHEKGLFHATETGHHAAAAGEDDAVRLPPAGPWHHPGTLSEAQRHRPRAARPLHESSAVCNPRRDDRPPHADRKGALLRNLALPDDPRARRQLQL